MIFIRYHQLVDWLIRRIWQDLNKNNKKNSLPTSCLTDMEKGADARTKSAKFLEFYVLYKWIFELWKIIQPWFNTYNILKTLIKYYHIIAYR